TEIDYGPVKFRDKDVQMWLPQSAEIFYYWKGRRIHRRHSFSNYLLFDVNDQQKISNPKGAEGEEPEPAAKPGKPNNGSASPTGLPEESKTPGLNARAFGFEVRWGPRWGPRRGSFRLIDVVLLPV